MINKQMMQRILAALMCIGMLEVSGAALATGQAASIGGSAALGVTQQVPVESEEVHAPDGYSAEAMAESRMAYICALADGASYAEDLNQALLTELEKLGWWFDAHDNEDRRADTKFYLAQHNNDVTGVPELLVVIPGTEKKKDIEVDLRFGKVLYGGTNAAEFQANAAQEKVEENQPMVHRGFNDYTMTAFFLPRPDGKTGVDVIKAFMQSHPKSHLYITGHSLGGAVATLLGARLISAGIIQPEQMTIYTYGAPAVGNTAFAEEIGCRLDLHRYTMGGDPVGGLLQLLKSGYTQVGTQYKLKRNDNSRRFSHLITEYLDAALRNYYDYRLGGDLSLQNLVAQKPDLLQLEDVDEGSGGSWFLPQENGRVYIAPCEIDLDFDIDNDEKYLEIVSADLLLDNFQHVRAGVSADSNPRLGVQSDGDKVFTLCRLAEKAGCDTLAIRRVIGRMDNHNWNLYRMSMETNIYNTRGELLLSSLNSSDTGRMTPIEAVLYGMARTGTDIRKAQAENRLLK